MDPEQLQVILVYAALVSLASLALRYAKPGWTRMRIALVAGGLLPLLGIALTVCMFVIWINSPPLPHDTDHHAMAAIGIMILLFLSLICFVVGIIVSFLVTMFIRVK